MVEVVEVVLVEGEVFPREEVEEEDEGGRAGLDELHHEVGGVRGAVEEGEEGGDVESAGREPAVEPGLEHEVDLRGESIDRSVVMMDIGVEKKKKGGIGRDRTEEAGEPRRMSREPREEPVGLRKERTSEGTEEGRRWGERRESTAEITSSIRSRCGRGGNRETLDRRRSSMEDRTVVVLPRFVGGGGGEREEREREMVVVGGGRREREGAGRETKKCGGMRRSVGCGNCKINSAR